MEEKLTNDSYAYDPFANCSNQMFCAIKNSCTLHEDHSDFAFQVVFRYSICFNMSSIKRLGANNELFWKKIGTHQSFLRGHWYPCFGHLVTLAVGFDARGRSLTCSGFLRFTSGAIPADLLMAGRIPFIVRFFLTQTKTKMFHFINATLLIHSPSAVALSSVFLTRPCGRQSVPPSGRSSVTQ